MPRRRAALLQIELNLLVASSKRMFPDLDDQVLAKTADLQGMGGGERHREHDVQPSSIHREDFYLPEFGSVYYPLLHLTLIP